MPAEQKLEQALNPKYFQLSHSMQEGGAHFCCSSGPGTDLRSKCFELLDKSAAAQSHARADRSNATSLLPEPVYMQAIVLAMDLP